MPIPSTPQKPAPVKQLAATRPRGRQYPADMRDHVLVGVNGRVIFEVGGADMAQHQALGLELGARS